MAAEGVAERAADVVLAGIGPRDGIEETLAAQMAACDEAALACFANARRSDLPESAKISELGTGVRLMSLFTQQLAALERHRTHLRQEREAAEDAERATELRRRFAEQDAEREAEEAVIYPERHARRLAVRAALAPAPQSLGAAVPEPPAAAAAPPNRQQRRAMERRQKKGRRGRNKNS